MRVKDNYVLQQVIDEYIVVPIAEEADRIHGVISLNESGAYLWNLLSNCDYTESDIALRLAEEYGIDSDTAAADTANFIEQLQSIVCLI